MKGIVVQGKSKFFAFLLKSSMDLRLSLEYLRSPLE